MRLLKVIFKMIMIFFVIFSSISFADTIHEIAKKHQVLKLNSCNLIYEKHKIFSYKKIYNCKIPKNYLFVVMGEVRKENLPPTSFKSFNSGDLEIMIMNETSYGFWAIKSNKPIKMECISISDKDGNKVINKLGRKASEIAQKEFLSEHSLHVIWSFPFEDKSIASLCVLYNTNYSSVDLKIISYGKDFGVVFWKNVINSLVNGNESIMTSLSLAGSLLNGDTLDEFAESYVIGKTLDEIKQKLYDKLDICQSKVEQSLCNMVVDVISDMLINIYQ